MKPVITITVNPAIDISAHVPVIRPDRKLHCSLFKKEAGGGGINVSRVINKFAGNTTAVYLAGGYTGNFLTDLLKNERINTVLIETRNHTRENFVVLEESSGLQYRFGMPGPVIADQEWKKCLHELSLMDEVNYIVASGSLSEGVPDDFFARIAQIAKQKKARFVVDTTGTALKEALKEGVFMIKPNLGELAALTGIKELNKENAIVAAKEIIAAKQCEVVIVSMGAAGALLVTDSIAEHILAPVVKVKSSVGAGDSMVAGIVLALSHNKTMSDAVRYGVACGAAATINEGTALCNMADAEHLFTLLRKDCKEVSFF